MNSTVSESLIKVAKGAAIAAGGAALTYLSSWVMGSDPATLFGVYAPAIVALLSVGLNAARKALESAQKTQEAGGNQGEGDSK